ncbi:MAG TPA: signal recognition particle-docking protein FtsY [Acidimicrobiales bacterium]|nr:signal recognition particle-docking protein FtsY [Acidimicrobiales bacterium]
MNVGTVVFIVVVLVIIGGAAVLIARRPRRGVELEPPAEPQARPSPAPTVEPPSEVDEATVAELEEALAEPPAQAPPEVVVKPSFRERLGKARALFGEYVGAVLARSKIDNETWDDLEEALIRADVGVGPTTELLDAVRARVKDENITEPQTLIDAMKEEIEKRLTGDRTLHYEPGQPNVWLFVGVNGVGKTTTIGKVGKRALAEGRSVVMAAGDTFRAAAAEQLELWAERVGAEIVRGSEGGDPSSIIFDAVQRADARDIDLVLADTAGRLHTKTNLMEELRKVRRVADRDPGKVTEVLLVLDATTGQNGLVQARQFLEAVEVTGVVLTKLDGSAKGGIVLAIQSELGIPVKLVGLGESADDLVDFDEHEFVEALFAA